MTFVNIPDTLLNIRKQLIEEYKKDKLEYVRLEDKYFSPDTEREWCLTARPELKQREKDLAGREDAIQYIERAMRILSKGELDYTFDGSY